MWSGAPQVGLQDKLPHTGPFNDPSHIEHIILIHHDANSLGWIRSELVELLHEPTKHRWRDGLFQSQ